MKILKHPNGLDTMRALIKIANKNKYSILVKDKKRAVEFLKVCQDIDAMTPDILIFEDMNSSPNKYKGMERKQVIVDNLQDVLDLKWIFMGKMNPIVGTKMQMTAFSISEGDND